MIVMDGFMDKLSSVKPYLITKQESRQSRRRKSADAAPAHGVQAIHASASIACCATPPARKCGLNEDFVGPAALALAHRYNLDSRDGGKDERADVVASDRGNLGMHLRRRLLGGLPQARRSRSRNPADQDFRLARLVQCVAAAGSQAMSRRPYVRKSRSVAGGWGSPATSLYMIRELTSLFIGLYCALLVIGVFRLARDRQHGTALWRRCPARWGVALQLVCLAFATYHSVTWFAVTPKAMPLTLKGRTRRRPGRSSVSIMPPGRLVSLVVLIAAGM